MTVQVIPTPPPAEADRKPGDGFLRTEGALAHDPYWDEIIEQIYRERKSDTRMESAE